ncbi:MAG: transcription termination/antitermination protein NusG, partial [Luteolibacter sp.]
VEPLFPGYILAKFSLAEMERAVTFCQGVRGLVRFGSEIPPIPEPFVNSLREEIRNRPDGEDELLSVAPVIQVGEEVEVAHGPLQGMRGTIVSVVPAQERVKILLDFLGQPQAVDVDLFSILMPGRPVP